MHVVKAQYVDVMETEGARVYTFRASTGAVDRQNEIVDQTGWSLDSYRQNPVVLDSHKYDSIEDVIGRAVRVEVVGDALEADIIFADTEKGECAEELVNTGFLRTVSVGFRSLARRPGGAGQPLTHTQAELLEISLVAVPANRDAVRLRSVDETDETEEKKESDLVGNNGATIEAKAGRVISSANLEKLQAAIDAIQMVIDAAGVDEPVQKPMAEACKPEEMKADAGVLDALMRFVGGNNGQ
jgi:HK97 family phage prohead protease